MAATQRTTETTSTLVSRTRLDLSPLRARSRWKTVREITVRVTLLVAILGPVITSVELIYFRAHAEPVKRVEATHVSPPIPAPFVNPGIIIVAPPAETETTVPSTSEIPETQRRTGKHRADEPETTTAPSTPPRTRRVAPVVPPPSGSTALPEPPPAAGTTVSPEPTPVPTTPPSATPIYDGLRNETISRNPNAVETIPQ